MRGGMTDALLGLFRPFAEHIAAALTVEVARRGEQVLAPTALAPDLVARDLISSM
jgi:hypothetical protein